MPLVAAPFSHGLRGFAAVQSVLLLAGLVTLGVQASSAPPLHSTLWAVTLLASAWALWAALRRRIGCLQALMVQAGALATATSAMGLLHWHWLFKPLTMVIAIIFVAYSAHQISARGQFLSNFWGLLVAALMGSLAATPFSWWRVTSSPGW